jgi:hypothetical protein
MSAPRVNRVAFGRGGTGVHFRSSPKADLDSPWRPPHGGRWQFGVPEFLVGCKVFRAQVQASRQITGTTSPKLPVVLCTLGWWIHASRMVVREV